MQGEIAVVVEVDGERCRLLPKLLQTVRHDPTCGTRPASEGDGGLQSVLGITSQEFRPIGRRIRHSESVQQIPVRPMPGPT